MSFAQ
jgi:hypothetical protein